MADVFELFSDADTRRVFEKIAEKKRTDFREIGKELALSDDAEAAILDRLENGGLVQRVRSPLSPVPVFDTFFLSVKGMETHRKMRAFARA